VGATLRLQWRTITPDGKTILVGDEAGALHILDWRPGRDLLASR
jgi:hypothetical protein